MENNTLINLTAVTILAAFFGYLMAKKKKVETEKQEIQQEMVERQNQLQEQQPECTLEILCQSDPQYLFMQDLVNQVNTYLSYIDLGIIINLVPLLFIMHNTINDFYRTPNKTGTVQQNKGNIESTNGVGSTNRRSVGSPLMPPTRNPHGLAEANAHVYLYEYFQQTDPLTTYLKKCLISKCISAKAIDHYNLINNLDRHFIINNIEQNEQNHILMAALNIYKIKEPHIGLIDNHNYKFSPTANNIAVHLAKFCLVPNYTFNPILNVFQGVSKAVGGVLPSSNEFLDKVEQIQKGKRRNKTVGRHF